MYNFMFSIKWYILGILKPIQVVLQFLDSYHKEHQEHRSISFWYFDLFNNEKVVLTIETIDGWRERGEDGKILIEMKYWQVTNDSDSVAVAG